MAHETDIRDNLVAEINAAESALSGSETPAEIREAMMLAFAKGFHPHLGGSAESTNKNVPQTGHGFSVGDVLRHDGSAYTLAQADTAENAEVIGVVAAVPDADTFALNTQGFISGLSGLTAGQIYYLSETNAGEMTATEPGISKPVLFADTSTSGYVLNYRGVQDATGMSLNDLLDVNTSGLADQYGIVYDAAAGEWIVSETVGSGGAGAQGGGDNEVFFENDINVTDDYTITSGKNALSAGPVTIDDGVTVTIPDGSVWTVI